MVSRFLYDGITSLCLSLIFVLVSYRFFAFQYGSNTIILLVFLLLICLAVAIFWGITYLLIKKGYYCTATADKEKNFLPVIAVVSGILFARFVFNGKKIPIESNSMLISIILLIVAVFAALGSVNLLKVMLVKNVQSRDGSTNQRTVL